MEPFSTIHYPDLIIHECIPDCQECSKIWINSVTGHKIVCNCTKCDHGKNKQNSLGEICQSTPNAIEAAVTNGP